MDRSVSGCVHHLESLRIWFGRHAKSPPSLAEERTYRSVFRKRRRAEKKGLAAVPLLLPVLAAAA
ncbi:hypothetical protein BN871_GR_00270 [Paenibacillus sp. P22]|nr:hypothetical protein BN871_GR_00270 [Paenibacillus sp. P22]